MYPAGGPPSHNQGYPVQYSNQVNSRQCGPGPLVNRQGTIQNIQQSMLGPPMLPTNFAPVPVMTPMCRSAYLPPPPQPQFMPRALLPSHIPLHKDSQGPVMQQDNFQRGGRSSGLSPSHSMAMGGYAHQGSTPSAPPPLFRPGPQTPSPKGASIDDQKKLNKSEKEDLYRMFGVVLQQHGPIEVTDSRLLSVFMGLSPWMRQGIKYLGGLKDFFRQGDIFKVDGDVVSLAWQEEEAEDKPKQSKKPCPSPVAPKPKSPISFKPKSPGNETWDLDNDSKSKNIPKLQSSIDNGSESSGDDGNWEGEEKQGWWLLDPLPGEDEDWKEMTPLQGKMGGGYYEDFRKLEEKDKKDPEETQKKLVFTSPSTAGNKTEKEVNALPMKKDEGNLMKVPKTSPTMFASVIEEEQNESSPKKDDTVQKKLVFTSTPSLGTENVKTSPPKNDSPTPWNWEESAIAQEAEAGLRRESVLTNNTKQSGHSPVSLSRENNMNAARSWPSDVKGPTDMKSLGEKSDSSSQEEEYDGRSTEMVYRSGSLHQAEDDVIILEDIEVSGTEEEIRKAVDGTDSAEDKSDIFTDALGSGQEDADKVDEDEQRPENYIEDDVETGNIKEDADKKDMMSDMISKVINLAISKVTSSQLEGTGNQETDQTTDQETDQNIPICSNISISEEEEGVSFSRTESGSSKSVRSVGVETPKPQQSHKAMCTREIKTRSSKVNTITVSTINRRVGTGEDPRIEELTRDLEKESRRCRHLADDYEDLSNKYDRRKLEYASETKEIKRKLDQTTKDLADCQRKLSSKGIVQLDELRKTTMELKDSESRLNAAKSKIARADKENYNLTKELEKTTRQLLDLEKSEAKKQESGRSRSTSTGGLEQEKDLVMEEENKLLKMRSRSAEQKVLELQYQYAMQSLNKALQESQYIFRMYGNSLLSSSHRELLRMKWMDYQMYIKEKTDEVATSYYSSLKALHQEVPLADIPSLKTQHVETFNPYKQSPVKAGEFGYINPVVTGLATPSQTTLSMPVVHPGVMGAGVVNPSIPVAPTSVPTKVPPGLAGAATQAPPGLSNAQVSAGNDLSMTYMQAQTQRGAPGKVSRRVPRKAPKALLAANFMSSLQHTTKVYGSGAAVTPSQPQFDRTTGGHDLGSQSQVHDWLDNMDTDSTPQNQVSAPTSNVQRRPAAQSLTEPQIPTPMDITGTQQPEGMDTRTTSVPDQVMMAPTSGMTRPAGIGRGKPRSTSGMSTQPPVFPTMESHRGPVEAMDVGVRSKTPELPDAAPILSDTATSTSRASSISNSRSASPLLTSQLPGVMERLSRPSGSKQASTAGSFSKFTFQAAGVMERLSRPPGSRRESPAGAVAGANAQTESASRPRPSSAGDALLESQGSTNAAKVRSVSLGGGAGAGSLQSSNVPSTGQELAQQATSAKKDDSQGGGTGSMPRFRSRQLRMPYHRGAEEEQSGGASSEGSGERWTTKINKRKRRALNLVEQQTQLIKEYRHLTGSRDTKPSEPPQGISQPQKQGSLDKLVSYLSKQFKNMTRKELTDSILQVRLDHNGSLSGIAMGTIISEASSYLTRAEKKKKRKDSEIVGMCAVCQDDLYGDPDERKLECGHNFHNKCIKSWVNEEGTCPICRKHTLFPEDFPRLQ
nr:uncharacterized protein LOC129257042 isoform X1 [Lytechinus pictus]